MTDPKIVSNLTLMPEGAPWMDHRPGLAFAGSGLDRAVGLRADPGRLADLAHDGRARFILFWRGRVLMAPGPADPAVGAGLLALTHDAAAFDHMLEEPIFLGLSADVPVFAADVSAWPTGAATEAEFAEAPPGLPEGASFAEIRGAMMRLDARSGELAAIARALLQWHESHGFCSRCGAPSRVMLGGWQRFCPGCGTHHFPRTDPVVIMRVTHGNTVLLGRSPGWPAGMYSCLAGFIEPGETVEAAVRREVFEETQIRVGPVRMLVSQPWPFPMQLMLACAGEARNDAIRIDPAEIEDALWVSRERLAAILAGEDAVIRAPRPGAVAGWMLRQWLADHGA